MAPHPYTMQVLRRWLSSPLNSVVCSEVVLMLLRLPMRLHSMYLRF
eukprot:SAG25_NODE_866_length_5015_cov_1.822213_7_plen_46_part_00